MRMTPEENIEWHRHLQTPVLFNPHKPIEINATSTEHVNLNLIKSTPDALKNRERILILTPLREASYYLPQYFDLISQLTYPHDLIDLAFLVGDSTDDTMATLSLELERVQGNEENAFRSSLIVEKDFDVSYSQEVKDRHSYEAQGPRRKAMARARNYLLATALKPEHSWVYWRDVDIKDSPKEIIEDFVAHDRDILVPSGYDMSEKLTILTDSEQISGFTDTRNRTARWSTLRDDVGLVLRDINTQPLMRTSRLQLLARISRRPQARRVPRQRRYPCRRYTTSPS
jgi:hypothetical protein